MTANSTSRTLIAGLIVCGGIAGAGTTYLLMKPRATIAPPSGLASPARPSLQTEPAEVSLTLSQEAMTKAKITVAPVELASIGGTITIPAIVEPNAYKQTVVSALVAGRVTRVLVELGQQVRRGQTLADIYSPELAEAQRTYISSTAELRAHEQELARVERLVPLGSASRQELEMAHAEHASITSTVEGARSRLELLGFAPDQIAALSSADQVIATIPVRAPLDGVVTVRNANTGLNVDGATALFTVVDLSTVWVVGDLYESDFPRVRVGSPATIGVSAYPELALSSRVGYIDPQLNRDTRTAKVRAEVQNGRGQLRLGMYAQLRIETDGARATPVIPKAAIQTVGDRTVVYVADPRVPGRFTEREIRTGVEMADRTVVDSGVTAGESVVSDGSFFLRAERERLGPATQAPSTQAPPPHASQNQSGAIQEARVTVSEKGFEPDRLSFKAAVPARITFVRTTDATCAKEVVFPSLNIRRALPLNTPVAIDVTPTRDGIGFVCGINMFRGTIVGQ